MQVDKLCICGLKFVELLVSQKSSFSMFPALKELIIIIIVLKKEVATVM